MNKILGNSLNRRSYNVPLEIRNLLRHFSVVRAYYVKHYKQERYDLANNYMDKIQALKISIRDKLSNPNIDEKEKLRVLERLNSI